MAQLVPYESVQKELSKQEAVANRLLAALAEATNVDEVTEVKDKAEALRAWARIAGNREAEAKFLEIRFRAERHIGEMIQKLAAAGELNTGTKGKGRPKKGRSQQNPPKADTRLTLKEVFGPSHKTLTDRARKAAAMSADEFETVIKNLHTIAKEELGRPLTLNLHIRRDHSRGAATDNKTRLAIVPALELLERRVKALDRPVSEVLRHTPRRTTLAPVAIEMLKQFLKSVSDWNEEGQQQQHDQAAEQESEKKPAKKKAKPKANTQPAETETVGG